MTPYDAAKLLELPDTATPEQIEARFLELRRKLEDKIAKAPTPGLQAKYRESLAEITQAFETLTLAADSSALPVLKKQSSGAPAATSATNTAPASRPDVPQSAVRNPQSPARKGGGKEFLVVAALAVLVFAAGGWWVMKTRAENAEKARLAAEAKAAADKAAEEKRLAAEAEKERQEKLITALRSKVAELNVAFEAATRNESTAERELSELKSQERDLARDQKGAQTPELRRLSAQVRAQDRYVGWLRSTLPSHPARVTKAKAEELLSARAADDASGAVDTYAAALERLKSEIATARTDLAVTGALKISSNLADTTWHLTDVFGVERSGTTPATVEDVAYGKGSVVFQRTGWPDLGLALDFRKGTDGAVNAVFPVGSLKVESAPTGAKVFRNGTVIGVTPLEIGQMPPGELSLQLVLEGHLGRSVSGTITDGGSLSLRSDLEPGRATDPAVMLRRALEDLPLIAKPETRTWRALSILDQLVALGTLPRAALTPLLDAHLAAWRAITDTSSKKYALQSAMKTIARVDLPRSRAWAEEALPLYLTLGDDSTYGRRSNIEQQMFMHPDIAVQMLAPVESAIKADDYSELADLARMHRIFGQENEAQRIAARARDPDPGSWQNNNIKDKLALGATQRQVLPLRIALLQGDLATAQKLFAELRRSGNPDFSAIGGSRPEFMALGDIETARQISSLNPANRGTAAGYLPLDDASSAISVGDLALAETLASELVDQKEYNALYRSDAYRALAEAYWQRGMVAEARAATQKIALVRTGATDTDRAKTAVLFAKVGLADGARQLAAAAQAAVSFQPDNQYLLVDHAKMHAAVGDFAAVDRVLAYLATVNANTRDYATFGVVETLAELGRFDDAKRYLARLKQDAYEGVGRAVIGLARVRVTQDVTYEELLDMTAPGQERVELMSRILALQVTKAESDRFKATPESAVRRPVPEAANSANLSPSTPPAPGVDTLVWPKQERPSPRR